MRVTKEGRLCATVAFGRVNDDSLDSQFCFGPVPARDKFMDHAMVRTNRLVSVKKTQGYPRHDLRSMSVMR